MWCVCVCVYVQSRDGNQWVSVLLSKVFLYPETVLPQDGHQVGNLLTVLWASGLARNTYYIWTLQWRRRHRKINTRCAHLHIIIRVCGCNDVTIVFGIHYRHILHTHLVCTFAVMCRYVRLLQTKGKQDLKIHRGYVTPVSYNFRDLGLIGIQ